ncbi:hypothetical protein [Candidatus Magnetominusculus xianensis]|uniref:ATPase (AAA+ superfamily) n=1 Tax=Candidatus Magnetominusculus xianensis TaxID=1748249 RepID=A0ABR5SIA8_9BACT|nr:hypothetical protein [Candidatus Magnetominusculus xianensis]KWT91043.1 putative ATPase (AAA+ superfamily) [Candidatus Magnetominusculus xianensis]MBF0402564.1 hypothetical protein [Nitrospirota bacterium]
MLNHANDKEGPSFVIGNIPKGRNMWDRDIEIDNIWKTLENDNVLLTACRRFGKTSIMNKMKENPQDDFVCFMFNVQSMESPHDFTAALFEEICDDGKFVSFIKKAKNITQEFLNRLEKLKISVVDIELRENKSPDWRDMTNNFVNVLSEYNGKILFLADELPEFILNIAKHHSKDMANDFLNWFRTVRQSSKLSNIRWLVGGSIGIEHAIKRVDAKVHIINDFTIVVLKPFSIKVGRDYITALLKKEGNFITIPATIIDKIMTTIGAPVPYFIQILTKESLNAMNDAGKTTLTDEIIEEAYHKYVLGPSSKTYFQHYYDRLSEYYDPNDENIVKRILAETARKGIISRTELFKLYKMIEVRHPSETRSNDIMSDIQNDFYVEYDHKTDSYNFLTNILKDWWLRYHNIIEE